MGCCSSVPANEDDNREIINRSQQEQAQPETQQQAVIAQQDNKSSCSFHSQINHVEKDDTKWPINVRLSSNGQDIKIQVPNQPPYMTIAELREKLYPHLIEKQNARIRLIYLGRLLNDHYVIIPVETNDDDLPLPPPKKKTIQVQKEGVIQAMVSKP